ncbi:MAG: Uma2 family endonuclease [Thermodesulfovibrionales bacterium]
MPETITEKKIYTYKDYEKLPEGAPYQLIKGELIMSPSPIPYHQRISKRLEYILYEYAEKNKKLGEVFDAPIDVYLEETEVYQPDIIFISKERSHIIGEKKIEGAPDLVIEILSPSSAYYDLRHKMNMYAKHNVKEYWIVDPEERSIEVYENRDGKFELIEKKINNGPIHSRVIPDLEVSLEEIF